VHPHRRGETYTGCILHHTDGAVALSRLFHILPSSCSAKIKTLLAQEENQKRLFLEERDYTIVETIINEVIDENKKSFINKLFNKDIPIGRIKITFPKVLKTALSSKGLIDGKNLDMSIEIYKKGFNSRAHNTDDGYGEKSRLGFIALPYYDASKFIISHLAMLLMGIHGHQTPAYLPVSRTGFMLAYNSIVQSSIDSKFNPMPKDRQDILTMPVIDFLKNISSLTDNNENAISSVRKSIVHFINNTILHGKITVNHLPVPVYTYIPEGLDEALPLYVSSGVVTETAPLLLML
jgi:hypothetical protein